MNSIDGVRVIGSFDPNEISDMTGLRCVDESLTHQEFKEETSVGTSFAGYGNGRRFPVRPQRR